MNKSSSLPLLGLLLRRFTLRHWRSAPRQTALQILILALGIAVFFSIRLANRAAVASFQNFTGLLTQQSDWQITANAGTLPVSTLTEIRAALGDEAIEIIPVVETTAAPPHGKTPEQIGSRKTFHLLGLDLVGLQNLASSKEVDRDWFGQNEKTDLWQLLAKPNGVFISGVLAQQEKLRVGDTLPLVVDENVVALEVVGIIPDSPGRPQTPANLLMLDLPALQKLAHREGKLDRIEFIVPDGENVAERRAALRTQLTRLGGNRWQVFSPEDRRTSAELMTRAFRMNLTILSLIGLLVGLYLIFQSLDGAVMRRREEIAVLRSLGVTEKIIRRVWLLEAALLGIFGGALGAALGWAGAQFAVRFVGRTVNALYYSTSVQSARLDFGEFLAAMFIAVAASLIAGWWPAQQAAKTPPAQILTRQSFDGVANSFWQSAWFAALVALVSVGLAQLPPLRFAGALRFPLGGYLAALGLIVSGGILSSHLLRSVAKWLRPLGKHLVTAKIATSHLRQPSSRHRLATAGLLCAVTMAAGMIILVASFETTMRGWIEKTFQADLYVTSDGAQSASTQNRISPVTWHRIVSDPAIAEANIMQATETSLNGISTMLVGVDVSFSQRHDNLSWLQAPLDAAVFDFVKNENLALVSESFSERFRVRRGERVTLTTPSGKKEIIIAGIFCDYGNERGSIVVDRRHFAAWFGDELVTSLILVMKPGVSPEAVQSEWATKYPGLTVLTNRYLRTEILRIFRQTFSVTYALELIGIIVAVIGLGMTLSSILLDRRSELTTLRALGWRRREMALATAVEGWLLSVCGVAMGLAVSLGLGWILIYVINKQSFGWTLRFEIPWLQLAALGLLVVVAGTVVAYGVGRWGSQLPADREE